jgi:hypothetical protein
MARPTAGVAKHDGTLHNDVIAVAPLARESCHKPDRGTDLRVRTFFGDERAPGPHGGGVIGLRTVEREIVAVAAGAGHPRDEIARLTPDRGIFLGSRRRPICDRR